MASAMVGGSGRRLDAQPTPGSRFAEVPVARTVASSFVQAKPSPELAVGLCGRAAHVPLRPNEGLGDLQARVAGTFGLTAPFDLLGPEGAPLRSDADAARAVSAASGIQPAAPGNSSAHVTVAAGEEALLDLERAHEESSALRWVLVRQLITGLRTQIAEVSVKVEECKHQDAKLGEQLMREQGARETGDASLRVDAQAIADEIRSEVRRERQELEAVFSSGISGLERRLEELAGRQATALQQEADALKQDLLDEREDRHRQCDEVAESIKEEQQTRQQGISDCMNFCNKLKAQLEAEAKQRTAQSTDMLATLSKERTSTAGELRAEAAEMRAEFRKGLGDAASKHQGVLQLLKDGLDEARREAQSALHARASKLEEVQHGISQRSTEGAQEAEARLTAHQAEVRSYVEGRLAQVGNSEPRVREIVQQEAALAVAKESSAREAGLQKLRGELEGLQLQERLQQEAAERRAGLDRTMAAATAAAEAAAEAVRAEAKAREAAFAGRDEEIRALISRVESGERSRATEAESLRAHATEAHGASSRELQVLRAACEELRASLPQEREAVLQEVWRALARQADECSSLARQIEAAESRLGTELREEQGERLSELQRHFEGLSADGLARMRAELGQEAGKLAHEAAKLEARTIERCKAQAAALQERCACCETKASAAAADMKAALDANSEVAAALESSQKLLLEHVNKQLEHDDSRQDASLKRVASLEQDMKKVRSHLPILFAAPSAFG